MNDLARIFHHLANRACVLVFGVVSVGFDCECASFFVDLAKSPLSPTVLIAPARFAVALRSPVGGGAWDAQQRRG